MQDTYGMNLDATVGYNKVPEENITFQYGWQAALSAQVSEKTSISAGYSAVNIEGSSYRFAPDDYRKGEFAFANVFYNVSPRIQLAAEYIWGRRTNNDGNSNRANRFYTMVQYSF